MVRPRKDLLIMERFEQEKIAPESYKLHEGHDEEYDEDEER